MSDLINRRMAIAVAKGFTFTSSTDRKRYVDFLHYCLSNAPTVEAVPVVHGEWVLDKRKDRIYCNHCNNYTPYEWNETSYEISELISNFCPSCGSDMRKKVQE